MNYKTHKRDYLDNINEVHFKYKSLRASLRDKTAVSSLFVSLFVSECGFDGNSDSRIKPIYSEFEIGEREIASSKLKN